MCMPLPFLLFDVIPSMFSLAAHLKFKHLGFVMGGVGMFEALGLQGFLFAYRNTSSPARHNDD